MCCVNNNKLAHTFSSGNNNNSTIIDERIQIGMNPGPRITTKEVETLQFIQSSPLSSELYKELADINKELQKAYKDLSREEINKKHYIRSFRESVKGLQKQLNEIVNEHLPEADYSKESHAQFMQNLRYSYYFNPLKYMRYQIFNGSINNIDKEISEIKKRIQDCLIKKQEICDIINNSSLGFFQRAAIIPSSEQKRLESLKKEADTVALQKEKLRKSFEKCQKSKLARELTEIAITKAAQIEEEEIADALRQLFKI